MGELKFLPPGSYIRVYDRETKQFKFYYLKEREAPLKYPKTFSALAPGAETSEFITDDLNPSKNHIYQAYLGVRHGIQVRVWHPYSCLAFSS